jgi:hypothetical protein
MHTPRSSNLLEVLGSIPVEGIGLDELAVLANQLLEARHVVMRDGSITARYDVTKDDPSTLDLLERMV